MPYNSTVKGGVKSQSVTECYSRSHFQKRLDITKTACIIGHTGRKPPCVLME